MSELKKQLQDPGLLLPGAIVAAPTAGPGPVLVKAHRGKTGDILGSLGNASWQLLVCTCC